MMNTKSKRKEIKKEINNITYTNKNIGFSITIPDTWMEVKKSSYEDLGINDNTLFIFVVNKFSSLTGVFSGFSKTRSFNKFFEKLNLEDKYQVLYQKTNEINKIKVHQLVLETDTNKIMHNFCLINGMIVNFTINVDIRNKAFDKKAITNDSNFKQMNEVLNTIKVFEPLNPPIYVDDSNLNNNDYSIEEKTVINEEKSLAQILIETECKYKSILTPELYLRYSCDRGNTNSGISIIEKEIYLNKLNGSFKFIKINEDLFDEIERILYTNMPQLMRMNTENKTNSKSTLLVKVKNKYAYIDLCQHYSISSVEDVIINILKEIKNNMNIDLEIDEFLSEEEKEIDNNFIQVLDESIEDEDEENEELDMFLEKAMMGEIEILDIDDEFGETLDEIAADEEIKQETDKEFETILDLVKQYTEEEQPEEEEIELLEFDEEFGETLDEIAADEEIKYETDEEFDKVLDNHAEDEEIKNEIDSEFDTVLNLVKEYTEEEKQEENVSSSEEVLETDSEVEKTQEEASENEVAVNVTPVAVPFIAALTDEENNNMDVPNVTEEVQEEQNVKEATSNYTSEDFYEYFHNIDGHASFRFLFPANIGEKIIREFNVFDIVNDNQLIYRVFLFKCEDEEKYESKLKTWMDKNIKSSNTTLHDSYTTKNENNLEVKTFILGNGKFYKTVYVYGYLIAISGYCDETIQTFANIALNNVEIGEDSREFVEAHDRKMRSINILQAQQIPYIDELPPIKSSYEITGKTIDEIAKRAIVLCICCNFASDIISNKKKRYVKESKKFFNKLLETFNVKDVMTKDEKLLFEKMDKDLAIQISWQFESYVILLWTLGLIDEVTFPDTLVEPDSVTAVVYACDSYREFLEKCKIRSIDEVLDLADLTYRYNWYCVESKINDEEPIMNAEVVMERHRALNWLLSDEKWDKVEINT